jgi:lipopolysaccharide export system permease protein
MEEVIEDLSNTKDKYILTELSKYPILTLKAHTRPFEHRWLNIISAVFVPFGLFFYMRMWRFRLRLLRDLRNITQIDSSIINRIKEMANK